MKDVVAESFKTGLSQMLVLSFSVLRALSLGGRQAELLVLKVSEFFGCKGLRGFGSRACAISS